MDRTIIITVAIAIALVMAGFLGGGLYQMSSGEQQGAYIINRLTGAIWHCDLATCREIQN